MCGFALIEFSPWELPQATGSVFMKKKLLKIIKSPIFVIIVFLTAMLSVSLTYSVDHETENDSGNKIIIAAVDAASDVIYSELATCRITTVSTTLTTTVTTTTTTSLYEVCPPTVYAGTSPNSSFYQDRMAVAGDSLALGFNYYGFIPDMHNIATESVSMWNLDYFTFNYGNGDIGMVDAVDYIRPRLLYMSVGMNDINTGSSESYVQRYREVIEQIRHRVPDINIVVAAITPVCSYCDVIRNDIVRDYNAALKQMVIDMDSPKIVFFDAYSVVCDENLDLRDDYTSGDGIHIYIPCYNDILTALFDYLDSIDFRKEMGG